MPSISVVKASNATFSPTYLPVAVFTGGTNGIGKAMAEAFAHYTNGKAHIIIVGRNRKAGETIVASFPKPADADSSGWKHEFVQCDLFLMKNVHELTKTLLKKAPRINFLVLSAGGLSFGPRNETEEGIDRTQAGRYYSRWVLIHDMLPALKKAQGEGQDASVLSIMGAGNGPKVDIDDLGVKKNFSAMKSMLQTVTYNDLMVAEFAKRNPDIAFTHAYPGLVNTDALTNVDHRPIKFLLSIFYPLLWLFTISPQTSAENMLYALFNGKKGMYRKTDKGKDLGLKNFPGTEEDQLKLWDHTVEVTKSG